MREPTHEEESLIASWIPGADVLELLDCIETKRWRVPGIICPKVYFSVRSHIIATLRRRLIELIQLKYDGRFSHSGLIYRSDGVRFWIELP